MHPPLLEWNAYFTDSKTHIFHILIDLKLGCILKSMVCHHLIGFFFLALHKVIQQFTIAEVKYLLINGLWRKKKKHFP